MRRRLRGLTGDDADEALIGVRQLLDEWLKASGSLDHPAYWILGYLSLPKLASHLTQPAEPSDPGPTISFVPPHGWKVKTVPFRLDLKHGKVWAVITTINELGFAIEEQLDKHWVAPPELKLTMDVRSVAFGPCKGKKFVILDRGAVEGKTIRYVLTVPGGYVTIHVGARNQADFDELSLESQLHTLHLSTPS